MTGVQTCALPIFSFISEQSDCDGGKALADGKHAVQAVRCAGSIVALKDKLVMAHEKKAVHGDLTPLQSVDHADDALAGNAGFLRCGFFECEHGCVHGSSPFGNGSLRGSVMI